METCEGRWGAERKMVSIVKVQVPLNGIGPALIYDEEKNINHPAPAAQG